MLPLGNSQRQARESDQKARFRNLNGAVLMERFRSTGAMVRLGVDATHAAVIQAIASAAPGEGWRFRSDPDRIVSGEARIVQSKIAELCGRTPRTVQRALRHLEARGLIETIATRIKDPHDGFVKTLNAYRVTLPPECAAGGAEGARDATLAVEAAQGERLRLATDAPPAPPSMRQGRHHPFDTRVPTHATSASPLPSEPSQPSDSSAAAAAAEIVQEAAPTVQLRDGRTLALARAPGAGGKPNGTATLDGVTVAVAPDAWAALEAGRPDGVALDQRKRGDGSAYWFASLAPENARRDAARRDTASEPRRGAEAPAGATLRISVGELRRMERRTPENPMSMVSCRSVEHGWVRLSRATVASLGTFLPDGETLEFDAHPSGGWVERIPAKPPEENVPF